MPDRTLLRVYCAAVFLLACGLLVLVAGASPFSYISDQPVTFGVLALGVVLGEMLPVRIPRRGSEEQITLSTSFSMALLVVGGLIPAVIAQAAASIIQDIASGKPWWRVRFNVGQYTVAMVAAGVVLRLVSVVPAAGAHHAFSSAQLPGMLLGAATFFVVNLGIVGVAVALFLGVSIRSYMAADPVFVLVTGVVMLLLAPIVLAAVAFSVALVPLCLAPVLAIYNTTWQSARSEHAARHDSLTGLPNRTAFHDAVKQALRDTRLASSVMLIDLDRFKDVNDTLGHRFGDLLLEQVARRFQTALGPTVEIARLGGDEFAVISTRSGAVEALGLARRLAGLLRPPFELEQMVVDVQASIGIAVFPEHGEQVETLLQRADVAMYRAKETGTGVELYDERHDHHSPAKLALTAELRAGIQDGGIEVWYQPELDLRSGEICTVEALARWTHPRLGLLEPASFITIAERTNLIRPLTDRVIGAALDQAAVWSSLGIDLAVAVDISAHVLADAGFTERVVAALGTAGVPASALKLEVTETTLMADPALARAVLMELHELGIAISIDDFGTGYSSLSYLARLPVSEVKIDRSFVSRMTPGSSETIIVNSTIDLAHHLDLLAVAEGVEDPVLIPELAALGCDVAQGYAISPPLCGVDATTWLLAQRRQDLIPDPLGQAA